MPRYDYGCTECENVIEVFHKMDECVRFVCVVCRVPMQKLLNTGAVRRPDAKWIKGVNGYMNDLEHVHQGRVEYIETREQARGQIKRLYKTPYPRPQHDSEVAANKRVALLRTRYLERY